MPEFIKRFRLPLIVAGGLVVFAIVIWLALISPQSNKLSSLHTKQQQLQAQKTQLAAQIATLRRDKANIASNCAQLNKALGEVPGTPSVDSFLQQVTALAVSSGDPNTPSIAVTQAPAAGAGAAGGVSAPGVSSISVTLNLAGTYGQMSQFLKGLDSFPRLFTVSNITVAGGPIASGGSPINPATSGYTLTLTGSVYYSASGAAPTICATTTTTTPAH